MSKYYFHSIALNHDEEEKFNKVKKFHNIGIKKIFMGMVNALEKKIIPTETMHESPTEPDEVE